MGYVVYGFCGRKDIEEMKKYKDLVVVVRCKDCKYCREDGLSLLVCEEDPYDPEYTEEYDFCSKGERRSDE